jgi:hypothetical protein
MDPEPLTVEELERVLRSERFATVHDLVQAGGFADLREGSRATERPSDADDVELPVLPSRK